MSRVGKVWTVLLGVFLLLPAVGMAQYTEEWQVAQAYAEKGILYFDYNGDGVEELTKFYGNTVTVYNGADNWAVLWSVTASGYDELFVWDLYHMRGGGEGRTALFIADNTVDTSTTRLEGYAILDSQPTWSTPEVPGYYSFIDTSDTNDDGVTDIVWGVNIYSAADTSYTSRFYITNGVTGETEYTSPIQTGYMAGPYCGDIDGDGVVEILFNLYNTRNYTSTLHAWSDAELTVVDGSQLRPTDIRLSPNYPNPFNAGTFVPVTLTVTTHVKASVYDINGRLVRTLTSGMMTAGSHEIFWDGRVQGGGRAASGMYFLQLDLGDHQVRRPMVLLK